MKCIDCGSECDYRATRCKKCSNKINALKNKKGKDSPIFGKKRPEHSKKMFGSNNPNFNKKHSEETIKLMSLLKGGTGVPKYEKYPKDFNEKLKKEIRQRDNYECQHCGMVQEEHLIVYGRDLEVHHIDYNRKNCSKLNLITLCKQCNLRANKNRDYWINYYTQKLIEYCNL